MREQMLYSIYKITNLVNSKCYIGYTENIERRWRQHKTLIRRGKSPLYQAFRKYGLNNFKFEIIFSSDQKDLTIQKEKEYIAEHNSMKFGYNVCEGGFSPSENNKEMTRMRMLTSNPMKNPDIVAKNRGVFKKGQKPIITKERNEKIRLSKLGEKNHNYKNPNATKQLNTLVECEKCGIIMNKGNYYRWHVKKCL
jgi:group I intron endonuclease